MKPTLNLIVLMVFCCYLSGCVGRLKQATPLSPSALNTRASYYNGKTVLVQGYVALMPEDHTLYESKELDAEATRLWNSDKNFNALSFEWTRYCLTIANPKPMYKHQSSFNKQTITVKGKFVDDYLTPRTIDLGACPLPTAIVVDYSDLQKRYPLLFK